MVNLQLQRMGEARKKLMKMYRVPGNMQLPHKTQHFGYAPSDAPNMISREGSSLLHDILCKHPVGESLRLALIQSKIVCSNNLDELN